jgi:hypothetical protein
MTDEDVPHQTHRAHHNSKTCYSCKKCYHNPRTAQDPSQRCSPFQRVDAPFTETSVSKALVCLGSGRSFSTRTNPVLMNLPELGVEIKLGKVCEFGTAH